jgi:HSP20 family protein
MARSQSLEVQEKREVVSKEEKTVPARYYVPTTDIFETDDALTVVMEIPGVERQTLVVNIENDVLRVDARIDFSKYEGLEPCTPSTMSVISPGHSPCRTKLTSSKSALSSMMAC